MVMSKFKIENSTLKQSWSPYFRTQMNRCASSATSHSLILVTATICKAEAGSHAALRHLHRMDAWATAMTNALTLSPGEAGNESD